MTRKHATKIKVKSEFTGRSYLHFDENNFRDRLIDINCDPLYDCVDVNDAWMFYIENISRVINLMCPLRSFKIKNMKDPWITNEIIESIHDKDALLRKAKRSNDDNDWLSAREARNSVNHDIKNIK